MFNNMILHMMTDFETVPYYSVMAFTGWVLVSFWITVSILVYLNLKRENTDDEQI